MLSAVRQASTHIVPQPCRIPRRLKAEGVGIIYISHRIEEVLSIADRVTVLRDGKVSFVERIELESSYGPAPYYPEAMRMTLHTADGSAHQVNGKSISLVPLRNRRHGEVARLAELVCRYEFDGRVAYGISEYHDRMTDGVPAGMHEA